MNADPSIKDQPNFEEQWRRACKRDPFKVLYNKVKLTSFDAKDLRGAEVVKALDFLTDITGDEAFRTAALALRAYQLSDGGLKSNTLRILKRYHGTAAWFAMPVMHGWKREYGSYLKAAQRTAVELGIPGTSFNAVVDDLRKTYPVWLKAIERREARSFPDGDTGRKLRVRFGRPWLGPDNQPINDLMNVHFGDDGFALAPDNREWRRLIHQGHISLCEVIEPIGKKRSTNNQDSP